MIIEPMCFHAWTVLMWLQENSCPHITSVTLHVRWDVNLLSWPTKSPDLLSIDMHGIWLHASSPATWNNHCWFDRPSTEGVGHTTPYDDIQHFYDGMLGHFWDQDERRGLRLYWRTCLFPHNMMILYRSGTWMRRRKGSCEISKLANGEWRRSSELIA